MLKVLSIVVLNALAIFCFFIYFYIVSDAAYYHVFVKKLPLQLLMFLALILQVLMMVIGIMLFGDRASKQFLTTTQLVRLNLCLKLVLDLHNNFYGTKYVPEQFKIMVVSSIKPKLIISDNKHMIISYSLFDLATNEELQSLLMYALGRLWYRLDIRNRLIAIATLPIEKCLYLYTGGQRVIHALTSAYLPFGLLGFIWMAVFLPFIMLNIFSQTLINNVVDESYYLDKLNNFVAIFGLSYGLDSFIRKTAALQSEV